MVCIPVSYFFINSAFACFLNDLNDDIFPLNDLWIDLKPDPNIVRLGCLLFWPILNIFFARHQLDTWTLALQDTRDLAWFCGCWELWRLFSSRAPFSVCYAILMRYSNSETAVYGCNPVALFWVLSVSCWSLTKLIFTKYDQHCSILFAEF